ncbi:hypothetical protein M3Y97_00945000 [Aphelenchoides bicaudatus]|nr:hypothetical protein M3Y97_00945000 [Aphelenchoides bicaudatus]
MNLNNNVISGLSDSLNIITRFNLLTRFNLMEVAVNGLPSSLFSSYAYLRNAIETSAWTSDGRLILRKSNDRNAKSIIYVVDTETGNTTQLSHNFDGYICQMSLGSSGHLYICASQWLTKKAPMLIGHNVMDSKPSNLRVYRTFRIPLSQSESLFFLAAASMPQTVPLNIQQLLKRRDDVPTHFYKLNSISNLLDHTL